MPANTKTTGTDIEALEDANTGAFTDPKAPVSLGGNDGTIDEKRQNEINAFLDEFASNDSRRRQLLKAIEENGEVEGGKYFQARFAQIKKGNKKEG